MKLTEEEKEVLREFGGDIPNFNELDCILLLVREILRLRNG